MATPRYALRLESFDGMLEAPYHSMTNRADAIRTARRHARDETAPDVMRVWVADSAAGQPSTLLPPGRRPRISRPYAPRTLQPNGHHRRRGASANFSAIARQ